MLCICVCAAGSIYRLIYVHTYTPLNGISGKTGKLGPIKSGKENK